MKRLTPAIAFESKHLSGDLARKSIHGGIATVSSQGILFVLRLVGTMTLARLLTPNDFGLVAMVTVITGFVELFKSAGLGMVTIQRDCISNEQVSTLFWLNLLIGTVLSAVFLAASPLVGMLYGQPELIAVTAVISVTFVLSGMTVQHQAVLYRRMMFRELAVIQITTQVVVLVVAVVLACFGWRYWALAVGMVVGTLTTMLSTFFVFPWKPAWIRKGVGARGMLSFGGHLMVFDLAYYISMNLDNSWPHSVGTLREGLSIVYDADNPD
jgi:O-antigen/teichoic acid export membrane protein